MHDLAVRCFEDCFLKVQQISFMPGTLELKILDGPKDMGIRTPGFFVGCNVPRGAGNWQQNFH
jgi:hypothetical protein